MPARPLRSVSSRLPSRRLAWAEPAALAAFALACLLLGGSSKPFAPTALLLRPVTVLCLVVLALRLPRRRLAGVRVPLLLLAAFAATMAIQLVPLPASLWAHLQGRGPYEAALASLGLGGRWHPLSLSPDRTWNSLVALLVPLAMLVGYAAVGPRMRAALLPALIAGAMASAVMAIAQLGAGQESALYFYAHSDYPPGLFANRNHQAAFLAIMFPALRAWTLQPPVFATADGRRAGNGSGPRTLMALGIGLFLIPMILVTGSRAGIALMLAGIAAAWAIAPTRLPRGRAARERRAIAAGLAAVVLVLGATLVLGIASGRFFALNRVLASHDVGTDLRAAYLPTMLGLIRRFWLFGIGFGAFDPVLRGAEPDALLRGDYFNNAHDDLIELVMDGGVASTLVLLAFLVWWGRSAFAAFAAPAGSAACRARAAAAMIGILLAASLVDYPLRTPLLGAVTALLCAWLAGRLEPGPDWRLPDERPATTPRNIQKNRGI